MAEEKIGDRLKRLRIEAELSQRELAKRSGVDREYICQLEANKTKSITLRMAEKLAKGLGKSPVVFFDGDQHELNNQLLIIAMGNSGVIDDGDIVISISNSDVQVLKVKKIDGEIWLKNKNHELKLAEGRQVTPLIEVARRLK